MALVYVAIGFVLGAFTVFWFGYGPVYYEGWSDGWNKRRKRAWLLGIKEELSGDE